MRQVPYKLQERDESTDQAIGFLPSAFALRNGEEYLSLGWLEYFSTTHSSNAQLCKAAIQAVRKDNTALHGVATVERTKKISQHSAKPVRLVYHPTDKNKSHSALHLDPPVPDVTREELAREFFKQHY